MSSAQADAPPDGAAPPQAARKYLEERGAVRIPVIGILDSANRRRLAANLERLAEMNCRNVILEIDVPGGSLEEALLAGRHVFDLRAADGRDVNTVAYIPSSKRTALAGFLVAAACDRFEMGEGASIEPNPDEIASEEIAAVLADWATRHGFHRLILRSLALRDIELYQVKEYVGTGTESTRWVYLKREELDPTGRKYASKEEVVAARGARFTIDDQAALRFGGIRKVFRSLEALRQEYQFTGEVEDLADLSIGERLVGQLPDWVRWCSYPIVQFLLILLGVLGIIIEVKFPGTVLPLGFGVLALGFFFAAAFMSGTAGWLDVGLFGIALVLLAVEFFVLPGFGVAGASGLILLVASLVMAIMAPGTSTDVESVLDRLLIVLGGLAASVVGALIILQLLPGRRTPGASGLVARTVLDPSAAEISPLAAAQVAGDLRAGQRGRAVTILRPAGKIEVGTHLLDVVSSGEYIERGAEVEIVAVEGMRIVVREVPPTGQARP